MKEYSAIIGLFILFGLLAILGLRADARQEREATAARELKAFVVTANELHAMVEAKMQALPKPFLFVAVADKRLRVIDCVSMEHARGFRHSWVPEDWAVYQWNDTAGWFEVDGSAWVTIEKESKNDG